MKRNSILALFLFVMMVLVGCSTTDVKTTEVIPVPVREPEVVSVQAVEPKIEEEVFEWTYDKDGISLKISATEEKVVVSYPPSFPVDSLVSDFSILEKATVDFEGENAVLTGLSLDEVKSLAAFLDFKINDYISLAKDPSYNPATNLSISEDSATYTVSTAAGGMVLSLSDGLLKITLPENMAEEEKAFLLSYLSETLNISFDEDGKVVIDEVPSLTEIIALVSSFDKDAAEYAETIVILPEVVEEQVVEAKTETVAEVKTVPVAEAVSKAIESARQIAEESVEKTGTWFSSNPLIVILSVVGLCILLGVLYYFTVHRLKNKKK